MPRETNEINHKAVIRLTETHPAGRAPYLRETRETLCHKTLASFEPNEFITPYDEQTTCPDCLAILGGRREGNKDVMSAVERKEKFHREHMFDKYSR